MGFGFANTVALGWAAGLNGGTRSVFWSGAGNLERAGAIGISLERTPIGSLMHKKSTKGVGDK